MKSICFVTTGDISKIAAAKRALGLANPLSDLGWKVSILMEDCKENRHRASIECDNRIAVRFFAAANLIQERKAKDKFIKEIDPDIIFNCALVARNIVGRNHRSIKLVEHSEINSKRPDFKGVKKWMYIVYEWYSLLYADGLIHASKWLFEFYKKRAKKVIRSKLPMLYLPYAYNSDVCCKTDKDYRGQFSRYEGKFVISFLGSIQENYGVFDILRAARVLKRNKSLVFLFMGKGPDYKKALTFVGKNDLETSVEMLGYVSEEDISKYFSITSAFISPMNDNIQDWARCPSKLYMYIPYEKPIITCKIGEPYEALKEKGYYYVPNDVPSLVSVIETLVATNVQRVSLNVDQFSWQSRAKELDKWIKEEFYGKR